MEEEELHQFIPQPKPKPFYKDEEEHDFKNTHSETLNPNPTASGICGQIEKLVLCKRYNEALDLFEILEYVGDVRVKIETYDALVSACVGLKSIRGVKRVFSHILSSKMDLDLYMMNRVLIMHAKCGMMIDALQLFEDMPERNMVTWNTVIGGLVDSGDYFKSAQYNV